MINLGELYFFFIFFANSNEKKELITLILFFFAIFDGSLEGSIPKILQPMLFLKFVIKFHHLTQSPLQNLFDLI